MLEIEKTEVKGYEVEESEVEDTVQFDNSKTWTKTTTLFLIDKMNEFDKEFSTGMKKNVWIKVAKECSANFKKNISWQNCEMKFKSLKRTYKTIISNNNTSGQRRRNWEYFEPMNKLLFNKPEITPVATCSSISRLHINIPETSHRKKRKLNSIEQRHKEKLSRIDRFNDLFEKMTEKM
ncbi:hypothetical protein ABEB36_014458 [Hypothenemus hampei]|uniref:Myb/SANT-like DNA-binding domain-containing protein n=1 Tax=Hypothenemus hampei TaxID=57062 RepID=A0ABD1E1W9_HYPHA